MTEKDRYKLHALELGPMENFVYLIHDIASNTAAIVDPAWEVDKIINLAQQQDIQITDILLTHSHHDHINGIHSVLDEYDAQLHLLHDEAKFWGESLAQPALHHGGDFFQLGQSRIEILHTPGHTPGSACYRIENDLITGDTMFVFGCGRCDLSGGDPNVMFDTLRKMKTELPRELIIHPGHNYSPKHPTSTMGAQCDGNPFMHFDNTADFEHYRMHVHDRIRETPYTAVSSDEALKSII